MRAHKISMPLSALPPRPTAVPPPRPDVFDLRDYFKVETYPSTSVIYRTGDAADRVFILRSGRVRLVRSGKGAERAVLAVLKPGDLFGDLLAVPGNTMDEMAVAGVESEVWSIEGRDFRSLIEARPALAVQVLSELNERVRQLRRRCLALTCKEVPARLAETILTLGQELGEECPHGGERDLRGVTQQDLADLVGASRSFVSTLINEMKRDGMLGNVGRTLCLRDQKNLRKLASQEK